MTQSHLWDEGIRYDGSIAEGPPPGKNHRQAIVYTCRHCGVNRVAPLTAEQEATIGDGMLPASYVKRRITAADKLWDGESSCQLGPP